MDFLILFKILFYLLIGSYKSDRPINITGIDKLHFKRYCFNRNIVNGIREPILYSFGLSSLPGHKIYKEPRIKFFEKRNNSLLSHVTLYTEDDDHIANNFKGEMILITLQLIII